MLTFGFHLHVKRAFPEVRLRGCEDACQGVWIRWSGAAGAALAPFQGLIQVRLSTVFKGCRQNRQLALGNSGCSCHLDSAVLFKSRSEHTCRPPSLPRRRISDLVRVEKLDSSTKPSSVLRWLFCTLCPFQQPFDVCHFTPSGYHSVIFTMLCSDSGLYLYL